jgi:hypothetical protein
MKLNPALPSDIAESIIFGLMGLQTKPVEFVDTRYNEKKVRSQIIPWYAYFLHHLETPGHIWLDKKNPQNMTHSEILTEGILVKALAESIKPYLVQGSTLTHSRIDAVIQTQFSPENRCIILDYIRDGRIPISKNGTHHLFRAALQAITQLDRNARLTQLGEDVKELYATIHGAPRKSISSDLRQAREVA